MLLELHHHHHRFLCRRHYLLLLLLLGSMLINTPLAFAYEQPRGTHCDDMTYYTPNSTFSTNLNHTLTTLRQTTAATGFSTTTSATVTALALCRATISSSDCQLCVDAAVVGVRESCPNQTLAQVWYTLCMVRYSKTNFINVSDNSVGFMLYDTRDAPDQVQTSYDFRVKTLMQNLSVTAGASEKRYAVGKTTVLPNATSIYGYVDCTRDIKGSDCTTCLKSAIAAIPSCCLGKWAGWIATPTCNIQFNMDPVHDDWVNPPPLEINTDQLSPPSPLKINTDQVSPAIKHGGGRVKMVSLISVILVVVVVVGILAITSWKWKNKRVSTIIEDGESVDTRSYLYSLETLSTATNNFSSENRLGSGGFGVVYRGTVPSSGEEIAVKKLMVGSTQGLEEFLNEFRLLMKMEHRNLVQLLGCCLEADQMMLVYEYLPNKSLDYFLFDKTKSILLDWTKRFNIIVGVSRGLVYLHEDSRHRIIHRDIKASNILLDEHMNPKISDFGLATLFTEDQTRQITRRIAGTYGYLAPEYALRGVLSTKADVYSFGVFMLETISGRKYFDLNLVEESRELLNFTKRLEKQGALLELADHTMGNFPEEDVVRCIHVGLVCCQERPQDRPTMSSVLLMLTNNSVTVPLGGRVGYQFSSNSFDDKEHNPDHGPLSGNPLSFSSALHGR